MVQPDDVLGFWLDELEPEDWYTADDAVDERIRTKFKDTWMAAMEGACGLWLTYPSGSLAYILLTDQFSRNMFRGGPGSYASDSLARSAAKMAIDRDFDVRIAEPARQFFYLPLMHSENLCDQDRAARLIHTRMPETGSPNLLHAKAHREVIRKFGRFPHRNEELGRATTSAEQAYLTDGGYGAVVRQLQAA